MGRLANLESRIVAVEAMAKANRPLSGLGTDVVDAAGGTGRVINAKAKTVAGGVAVPVSRPFFLLDVSSGGDLKIRVVYGTVNGMLPDGMSAGDVPQYVLTVTVTGFVYLVALTTGSSPYPITDLSIAFAASVPADTSDTFYFPIGSCNITAGVMILATSIDGSQAFRFCTGAPIWAMS